MANTPVDILDSEEIEFEVNEGTEAPIIFGTDEYVSVLDYPRYDGSTQITPTSEAQTLATENTVVRSNIIIDAVPSQFVDISDTTAVTSDVRSGKYFYTSEGTKTEGSAIIIDTAILKGIVDRTITELSLPLDLTSIGQYAFRGCTQLTLPSLPSGINSIGEYAFYACYDLDVPSLPSGITSIGQYAFYNCKKLSVTELPERITYIPAFAFGSCTKLAITEIPSSVTGIGEQAFSNCTRIYNLSLPSVCTSIGNRAFYGCTNLTRIVGTGKITSIGTDAFRPAASGTSNQMSLISASFPNMTISSLSTAFGNSSTSYGCKNLRTFDAGKTKALATYAFGNCNSLTTLILRRDDAICSLNATNAFINTPMAGYQSRRGTVYVPSDLIETYKTAANWSTIYGQGYLTFAAIEGSEWELSED